MKYQLLVLHILLIMCTPLFAQDGTPPSTTKETKSKANTSVEQMPAKKLDECSEPQTEQSQNSETDEQNEIEAPDDKDDTSEITQVEPKMLVLAPAEPSESAKRRHELSQLFYQDLPNKNEAKKEHKEKKDAASYKKWIQKRREPRKPHLTISEMNFQQLLQRKNELILEGDYETAIKYLERMFRLTEHAEQLVYIMLEWAELLMKTAQYAKAEKLFDEFIKLYPGNQFAEQAFAKAIECSWNQTSRYDRDQTKTEKTLDLIKRFETRTIYDEENRQRVAEIKECALQKLADRDLYIAQHYIGNKMYLSAHKRLDSIRSETLQSRPNIEPELLHTEIQLAQAEQNQSTATKKIEELCAKFPEHELTQLHVTA